MVELHAQQKGGPSADVGMLSEALRELKVGIAAPVQVGVNIVDPMLQARYPCALSCRARASCLLLDIKLLSAFAKLAIEGRTRKVRRPPTL